jgi:hypothetical protein
MQYQPCSHRVISMLHSLLQQVQSPFANGPGGLLLGTSAGMAPAAEAGPSTGRMKAPAGSSGLPGVLNRALQAFPSGSGDASRRSSTSSYQHMTTAAAGGSGGMREYPSSARQMSCLGTGRYGSAMRGDGSGGLLGDTGDAQGATRPRRTTRRTVESRHKVGVSCRRKRLAFVGKGLAAP